MHNGSNPSRSIKSRLVPVTVETAKVPVDVGRMFNTWLTVFDAKGAGMELWMPIGRCGPLLILAHSNPDIANSGLPPWAFGYVRIHDGPYRLLIKDYEIKQKELEVLEGYEGLGDILPPTAASSVREIAETLAKFPCPASEVEAVKQALIGGEEGEAFLSKLPPGWREAVIAVATDCPVVDIGAISLERNQSQNIPDAFAREKDLVPVQKDNDILWVASPLSPTSSEATSLISAWKGVRPDSASHLRMRLCLSARVPRAEVERRLNARAKPTQGTVAPFQNRQGSSQQITATSLVRAKVRLEKSELERFDVGTNGISDETLLHTALYQAIRLNASDLHIDYSGGQGRARIRKDGILIPLGSGSFGLRRLPTLLGLLRVWCDASGGTIDPVDGKFSLRCDESYFDIRTNIMPAPDAAESGFGYATLRFLPKDTNVRSLSDLLLGREEYEALTEMMDMPNGIILVTGPTGSGKTTTLNAIIQTLNKAGGLKIMTAEDPVEYVIDGIQQVNVTPKLNFAEAIRRFMRADPDVILIGEIRDRETAEAAISAARSGHLVFSTLHTNGAAETVARLRNLGIPNHEMDGTIVAMIAQRLVRKLCRHCKIPGPPPEHVCKSVVAAGLPTPDLIYEPNESGCPNCFGGWSGRIPILEIVKADRTVKEAIARGVSETELKDIARKAGYKSLRDQGLKKVVSGETNYRSAMELESNWS